MASAVAFALLLAVAAIALPQMAAGQEEEYVQLAGHLARWATPGKYLGPAPAAGIMHTSLHLGYRNPAAVKALADAVSNPSSPRYGHFITVQQFTARFAPSAASVAALAAWARGAGLHVAYVATNRKYLALEGTVAQFSAALRIEFGLYDVRGVPLRAPSAEPSMPASLARQAGVSMTFAGLDQGWVLDYSAPRYKRVPGNKPLTPPLRPDGTVAPGFSFSGCAWSNATKYTADPNLGCGYKPQQLRTAYGVPSTLTGKNQTVAIIDAYASPFMQQDLDTWSSLVGLNSTTIQFEYPPFTNNATQHMPPGYDSSWQGEESLDIEIVHGMAPDAKIVYVGAASNNNADLFAALNWVIEKKLASIVSNSYSGPLYGNTGLMAGQAAYVNMVTQLAMQAATNGIGIYFSSGDDGDDSMTNFETGEYDDVTTPNFDSADPYVTAVGGTTLAAGASGQYIKEYGWGELLCDKIYGTCSFYFGAGGGVAYTFATPSYQRLISGPQRVLTSTGNKQGRVVPDVAAIGDPFTGYIIGYSAPAGTGVAPGVGFNNGTYVFQLEVIGGTSLACPAFAAMMALKQQLKNKTYGFANNYFYSNTGIFRDILPAPQLLIFNNSRYNVYVTYDTSLQVASGYDNITGIGTPGAAFWYQSGN